uniref:Superfamily Cerm-11 n=1 Tax=Conus magus TaxID=6492 RepID=A0A5P8I0Z5_CONMA|nr:superfamily Cerm-11 [Conus magus]UMA82343.1 conotoxin precursor Cerm11 [Conus ebraeus]UMA83283.1 conotoxin precursor Cerm11 [Conus judaeus]
MDIRWLVTAALLLSFMMSIDSVISGRMETGRFSPRETSDFPCNGDQCVCWKSKEDYQCQSVDDSANNCVNQNCTRQSGWG